MLRGLAFVAAGVVVLVNHDAVIALLLNAIGIYLIYEGVSAVLRLVYRPDEEEHAEEEVRRAGRFAGRGSLRWRSRWAWSQS